MSDDQNPTTESLKAGRRHNEGDMRLLAGIHDDAHKIAAAALMLGHVLPEPGVQTIKADLDVAETVNRADAGTIKAVGDGWTLDVLGVPFGGPHGGKDSHGEYFSPRTKTHHTRYPNPQAVYYHGFTPDGQPQGEPVEVGEARYSHSDAKGHWYRVVLDRAVAFAHRIREGALKGLARASTGTIGHLKRVAADGEILNWPVVELSIFDTDGRRQPANQYAVALPALKARFDRAGKALPDFENDSHATPQTDATGARGPVAVARRGAVGGTATKTTGATTMDEKDMQAAVDKALAEREAEREAEQAAALAEQEKINAAVKMALAQSEKQFNERLKEAEKKAREAELRANRLPLGGTPDEPAQAPRQAIFADTRKADTLSRADTALTVEMLRAARQRDPHHSGPSNGLLRALAIKMAEDKSDGATERHAALKAANLDPHAVLNGAIKSDEINYSTLASGGDDWVGQEYSRNMWEAIRLGTFVLMKLPQVTVPEGAESIIIPVESTDPTWYKVAQAADENGTTKRPDATVTSSKLATTSKTLSVAKVGARSQFTGELVEDSLIPWAAALRRQLEISGAEIMEHLCIDGDTETGNAANINDIDGTPTATDVFLTLNGFRKSCLVTTTANSRSASGSLTDTDFLETVKLMGTGGLNAMDKTKVDFIIDLNTHWKALQLASVKTRDVFGGATIENGVLTSIWGYPVRVSANMHRESAKRMAESTGKIDQTDSDNTLGAILAVRYDQWLFGYKRRMQLKLQEFIDSDVTQIVALARVGMVQRDTEASAITYNVGVA